MVIKPSERKTGTGTVEMNIGFWKGPLLYINPDKATLEEIYVTTLDKDPQYNGEDKNGKDWSRLQFVFQDEVTQKYVNYSLFISDEIASFEKDGITKTWYVNQHGQSQLVDDEKNLFKSFTHMQKQNEDKSAWEDVLDESGNPVKLIYRQAHRGETALYSLLRKLVTQDWFQADAETNLFIKIQHLLRGAVKDISMYIGTDTFQSVVGMEYVEAKDTDSGVQYTNNCVDHAWIPMIKIKDANIATASNSWGSYETRPKGKGSYKKMDMHQFYSSVKRNKYMWEFAPLHVFEADKFVQAGSSVFVAAPDSETPSDTSY